MIRKTRPDSTIGSLAADLKDQVDEMLLSGEPYRKVQELLADADIPLSLTSIAQYYQSQILPTKIARQNRTAAELNRIAVDGLDEATLSAIRSSVFDLASAPGCNAKAISSLFALVLKAESLKQDDRKIRILEDKVAQAKALAAEILDTSKRGLTDETVKILEDKIKLM